MLDIRAIRVARGLSLTQLSLHFQVPRRNLSAYELGQRVQGLVQNVCLAKRAQRAAKLLFSDQHRPRAAWAGASHKFAAVAPWLDSPDRWPLASLTIPLSTGRANASGTISTPVSIIPATGSSSRNSFSSPTPEPSAQMQSFSTGWANLRVGLC